MEEHKKPHMPPMMERAEWKDLGDGIYNIASPPVGFQQYVVIGMERAALIDTGMGIGSIADVVKQITSITIEPGVEVEVTIADS